MGSWQISPTISRDLLDENLAWSALPEAPVVPPRAAQRRPLRPRLASVLRAAAERIDRDPTPTPACTTS
ncbi:MAG TPA: hypothetical protein VK891_10750 [Euzebyales bacterium]|nr:hypothetical protein [Euzebyales bacterium]